MLRPRAGTLRAALLLEALPPLLAIVDRLAAGQSRNPLLDRKDEGGELVTNGKSHNDSPMHRVGWSRLNGRLDVNVQIDYFS